MVDFFFFNLLVCIRGALGQRYTRAFYRFELDQPSHRLAVIFLFRVLIPSSAQDLTKE